MRAFVVFGAFMKSAGMDARFLTLAIKGDRK